MAAEVTGTVFPYALGGAAAPGAQSITVPADALAVVFFSNWYASAGTTLTITTDFTVDLAATANAINGALVSNVDEYLFRGWAKITGIGSKTFTPVWNNSQGEGPLLFVAFVKGIDPDVPPRDWDGVQERNTTTTPAITLDTNTGDLVLVMNRQYNSGGTIPGTIAGTTSLATLANRSEAGLVAKVDAPGATSTTLTSTVNSYAGITAIAFAPGSGADTVVPIMSGAITPTRLSDTSYSVTGWGASDNVGVTGFEIRVNAGAWLDIGLLTTHTFTGRTYQATDPVEVRAYDAALNYSLPLSRAVVVGAVMVPISALDCAGNLETDSNVQLQWRSVDGAMPPHKTSLVIAWEWFDQVPSGTEFYTRWWDLPNDTHSTMPAGNRFVGYHPYPTTPNTNHVFEIAGLPSNDAVTLEGGGEMAVVKGQWYATAHYKEIISGGATLRHVYYPDITNSANRIVVDVAMSLVDAASISDPVLRLGGGNWTESGGGGLNSEAINGKVRGIRMFDISGGTPTRAQIIEEAEAAWEGTDTPASLSGVWYINDNPTPTDVADKSGQGHNPAWRTTPRPVLWVSEVPTYPTAPAEPQIARPDDDISAGAWTPSTGATLAGVLDEAVADDGDYITTNSNSTAELALGPLDTPDAGTQTLTYRAAGSASKALKVGLYRGATLHEEWTTDPLADAVTEYVRTLATAVTDVSDLRLRFTAQDAASPPAKLVTWGAVGTAASGTTTAAPAYPTGISASTSKLFCVVTGRSNTADTAPTMPAGWTKVLDFEGGVGTWGVDAGTRRVTVFQKDTVTGSETGTVTVSLAGTTSNTLRAGIHRVEVPAGYGISLDASTGADITSATNFSATGSTSISLEPNDLLMIVVAQSIDSATQSAQSITASGITFGTRTNRATTAVTNGNDHRHIIDTVPVSSGTATVAPTYAYTASAATSGPVGFLRMRAVTPTEFARVTSVSLTVPGQSGSQPVQIDPAASASGATVSDVTISQTHLIDSEPSSSGATVADVTVSQTGTIDPAESFSGATVGLVDVVQTHVIAPSASSSGATVADVTISQTQTIDPAASLSESTVGIVSISQTHLIAPAASNSGTTVTDVTISQTHQITPAASSSGATVDPVVFIQGFLGSTILSASGIGTNGPGILHNDMRVGDDAKRYFFVITRAPTNGTLDIDPIGTFSYTGTSDSFDYELFEDGVSLGEATVTLSFSATEITADPSNSGATVALVVVTQTHIIGPAASSSGASVASVVFGQTHNINPAASSSGATVAPVDITGATNIDPLLSTSGASVSVVPFTQTHIINPSQSLSGASVAQVDLTGATQINPDPSNSGAIVPSVVFTQTHVLAIQGSESGAIVLDVEFQSGPINISVEPSNSGSTVAVVVISMEEMTKVYGEDVAVYPVSKDECVYPWSKE